MLDFLQDPIFWIIVAITLGGGFLLGALLPLPPENRRTANKASKKGGLPDKGEQIKKRPPPPTPTGPRPDKIVRVEIVEKGVAHRSTEGKVTNPFKSTTALKAAADRQAQIAEERAKKLRSAEGTTYQEFLEAGVRAILDKWPEWDWDTAMREFKAYVELIAKFPDPDYDWSKDGARSLAEELMQEIGETHGSNS